MKKYERVIRYAMEMELEGSNFFKENAEKVHNETAKTLFLNLAKSEMEHYEYLKRHLEKYASGDSFEIEDRFESINPEIFEQRSETEHVEEALKESDIPDITILRMAYLIERDYKEFYQQASDQADEPIIKELFETLATWEAGHEIIFKKEYDLRMQEYLSLPWGG